MSNITKIYQGYLDLIEYLEEKFLGGVYPLYYNHPDLLIIDPATQTMLDALIIPACKKFNALGSTQLVVTHNDPPQNYIIITTSEMTETLGVLYTVAYSNTPAEYTSNQTYRIKPMLLKPTRPPGERHNLDSLRQWLRLLTSEIIIIPNIRTMEDSLQYCERYCDIGEEGKILRKWLLGHTFKARQKGLY